jgi:hypothetical protein
VFVSHALVAILKTSIYYAIQDHDEFCFKVHLGTDLVALRSRPEIAQHEQARNHVYLALRSYRAVDQMASLIVIIEAQRPEVLLLLRKSHFRLETSRRG